MANGPEIKPLDGGFVPPRRGMEGDLPGYKPKPKLEKAPYVKDRFGFIWHWQPWMSDMGDVLEPCWEAPPQAKLVVPVGIDLEMYSQQVRQPVAPQQPVASQTTSEPVAREAVQVRGRRGRPAKAAV